MIIGTPTRELLSRVLLVHPTERQLAELERGPERPLTTIDGSVIELASPAGGFAALRWMGHWQELESEFLGIHTDANKRVLEQKSAEQRATLQELADEAWRSALFCGYQKALSLAAAADIYRWTGMSATQLPAGVDYAVVTTSGVPIVDLDRWASIAEVNRQTYLAELLDEYPAGDVEDFGRLGSARDPDIGVGPGVVIPAVVVQAVVLLAVASVALALLSWSGVFRTMFPNRYAAGEAARALKRTLASLERECRRLPTPEERVACLERAAATASQAQEDANQARQEQWAATVGGITSLGSAALPLAALGVVAVYLWGKR